MMVEGWKRVTVSDLATVIRGSSPRPKGDPRYYGGDVPRLMGSDVSRDGKYVTPRTDFLTEAGAKLSRPVPAGTLTVVCSGDVGVPSFLAVDACIHDGFLALQDIAPECDREYLFYTLDSLTGRLERSATHGGVFTNLTTSILKNYPVDLPPLDEQIVIAKVLSSWDRSIGVLQKIIVGVKNRNLSIIGRVASATAESWTDRKLGDLFTHRKKKGTDGLPTYSVTMDNGLVLRDSLERKNETSLRPDEHLLIEKDDIAYNMMRMWQGASGLASESGLVSPAYVVLRSQGEVDPLFASYWFKTPRVIKKFQDYSHGLTKDRLRLYYKDFASIALPVPPLELQRKIARTLAACDRELDLLRRKLDLLKQQKQGLMQQLLTGKVRVKVPEGVA